MKTITKIMPIIQVIWVYGLIVLFCIGGNDVSLPYGLLIILCIIINVITIISALSEKKEYKKLALINTFFKIAFIPYYLFIILLALSSSIVLSITGIGVVFLPIVYFILFVLDYALLCTTSTFGISAMTIAKKNGSLSKTAFILLTICHFVFVLDVLASIVLYFMIRSKNDTEEDVKFRKTTRVVLIIILLLSLVIGGFVAIFHGKTNEQYHKKPYTVSEMEEYVDKRFASADKVSFTLNSIEGYDANNKQYKEWSVTVNDIPCHVASIETEVKDKLTGKTTNTYYRTETDYDYCALKKHIDDNIVYSLWEMESTYSTRYDEHSVYVCYTKPIDGLDAYSLGKIEDEIKQISSSSDELLIQKEIIFKISKNGRYIIITKDTTDQLYKDI